MDEFIKGLKIDVLVKGTVGVDVLIDNKMFMQLPASVQKEVLKQGVKV